MALLGCTLLTTAWSGGTQAATPWPQWGGPDRNFKIVGAHLPDAWPKDGPKTLWRRDLGDGYSSIVTDGRRLYTMYRIDDDDKNLHQEAVIALDPADGKTLWEHKYDAPFAKDMQMNFGPGPHSTPLIVGDRLYTVGIRVHLLCLDKRTGKLLWSHDLEKEYDDSHLMRGYGSSPLAYKDLVILPIGGKGHAVVAFNQADGKLVWKNQGFGPTYSSPILIHLSGEAQLVVFADKAVNGLDPDSGRLLWSHDHPTRFGANISTPVAGDDGYLFISSAYGMGSRGVRLTRKDGKTIAQEAWYNKKMKIHHGNAVRVGDYVYGSSGDFGPVFFTAINVKTGKIAWRQRGIAKATCLYADGKMIILDEDGNLVLASVGPEKMEILAKAELCKANAWTVPTLAGKTLYLRDRKEIIALDLH